MKSPEEMAREIVVNWAEVVAGEKLVRDIQQALEAHGRESWNAAIEAAAKECMPASLSDEPISAEYRSAIRVLRKPAPGESEGGE